MAKGHQEIEPETRLALIELAEGFAEGVRNGTFRFTEGTGLRLAEILRGLTCERQETGAAVERMNITLACQYIGISQPTFRKYVRIGRLPVGMRQRGSSSPEWKRKDLDAFREWWFSEGRKEER